MKKGNHTVPHSQETKDKISAKNKGRKRTEDERKRIADSNRRAAAERAAKCKFADSIMEYYGYTNYNALPYLLEILTK